MPKLLEIAELGQPILRGKARPVENVYDEYIQELIDDMIFTTKEVNGVGIAAPQVFKPYQLFIVASYPNKRYPQAPTMEPEAFINPRIISHSPEINKDWEGCLSIPGLRGLIPRYSLVSFEYTTRDGIKKIEELSGFEARIFQHEYDHINGVIFLDRIEKSEDIFTEKEYLRLISETS